MGPNSVTGIFIKREDTEGRQPREDRGKAEIDWSEAATNQGS